MVPCLVFTPPHHIHRGGGIHGHMHIIYAYIYILFTFAHAHTTYIYTTYNIYIYMYNLHIHIGTITISGGEGTTRRWAIELCTYTWTVLEPHSFRSLWIFRCRPKNHFWAKSDGFNDTVLVSKSWSFASFLHHFASFFCPSKCDWQRAKSAIVRFLVAHYFSVQTKKNAASGCPGMYTHV